MPKIIDHDAHKKDIARRAASYFSKHGYSGVGMRGVAQYLGMSKGALYHYFPNKEALFLACTKQVMRQFPENKRQWHAERDDAASRADRFYQRRLWLGDSAAF